MTSRLGTGKRLTLFYSVGRGGRGTGLRGERFVSDKKLRQIIEETRIYPRHIQGLALAMGLFMEKVHIQREIQVHVKTLLSGVISSSVPIC